MPFTEQSRFLDDELFSLTLMATTQRGKLYRANATKAERAALQGALRGALAGLTPAYENAVSDSDHVANIDALRRRLTASHGSVLAGGKLRVGSAQKALNLHLKYMWCLDRIAMPPHCPLDSTVLKNIPGCGSVRWTQLDSLSEYRDLISKARRVADKESLALWELRLYNAGKPIVGAD
jgi:hypothetical protein